MINSDYLNELIKNHGYTLGMLSRKSGISKAQLSRTLRNKRGAGPKTMEGILKAFPEADMQRLFFYSACYQKGTQTDIDNDQ